MTTIKSINNVQPLDASGLSKVLAQAQAEAATQTRATSSKAHVEAQSETSEGKSLADVSIHFRVDEDTNNVTIFLVDRATKKVLRSIPAGEMQKLQIGDLLKLTA